MPTLETIMVFFAAALAITLVPGPSMLYVASRSIGQGKAAGIWSALGLATGLLIHTACASLGLSAILLYSPLIFLTVKYLGAGYLIYLGVRTLLSKQFRSQTPVATVRPSRLRIYEQGIITEVLNPKTALFFFSFLPQFVDPLRGPSGIQMMVLGGVLVFLALAADLLIAVTGGTLSQSVFNIPLVQKVQKWISGTALIALGLRIAISERH